MESNFGASAPYTVGVEEELQLVDPTSLALVPAIETVLTARDAAGLPEGSVASELSASCVEVRSPAYGTVAELAEEFPALRRRIKDLVEGCEARLAAAGTHPFSEATAQKITAEERYRRVDEEMSPTARMQTIYGLHVAVSDEERAIRAVAALSHQVPLFIALSANSPFWAGADTRLASAWSREPAYLHPSAPGKTSRTTWSHSSRRAASRTTPGAGGTHAPTRGSAPSSYAPRTPRRNRGAPPHWPRSPSASWPPPRSTPRRVRCLRKRTSGVP